MTDKPYFIGVDLGSAEGDWTSFELSKPLFDDETLKRCIMTRKDTAYAESNICPRCFGELVESAKSDEYKVLYCEPCHCFFMVSEN